MSNDDHIYSILDSLSTRLHFLETHASGNKSMVSRLRDRETGQSRYIVNRLSRQFYHEFMVFYSLVKNRHEDRLKKGKKDNLYLYCQDEDIQPRFNKKIDYLHILDRFIQSSLMSEDVSEIQSHLTDSFRNNYTFQDINQKFQYDFTNMRKKSIVPMILLNTLLVIWNFVSKDSMTTMKIFNRSVDIILYEDYNGDDLYGRPIETMWDEIEDICLKYSLCRDGSRQKPILQERITKAIKKLTDPL